MCFVSVATTQHSFSSESQDGNGESKPSGIVLYVADSALADVAGFCFLASGVSSIAKSG